MAQAAGGADPTRVSTPVATPGSSPGAGALGGARSPATPGQDWTVQAADTVERVVAGIRNKTSLPLTTIARTVVFGLLAAVMGITALVLGVVGLVRVVDRLTGDGNVWIAYLAIGVIFTLVGAVLLRKATAAREE